MHSSLISLKNILTQNIIIKILSLMIGYGIWLSLAQLHTSAMQLTIPLCFYGTEKQIQAPDLITVHLSGKRHHLTTINPSALAIHINADSLHDGQNQLILQNSHLFLPKTINVIHWSPTPITIIVHEELKQEVCTKVEP